MIAPRCKDILNLIPLYIDGLLDEKDASIVKEHIDQCPNCKKEADLMLSIMTKTKELPEVKVTPYFSAKVTAKAKLQKAKKQRTVLLHRISSGVAVAAVLALCVVSFDAFDTKETLPENSPVLSAEKASDKPDIINIPKTEEAQKTTRVIPEKAVVPDESVETPMDETVESFTPAFFCEVELEYFTIATVEVTEENQQTVEELIKDYEKDDTGYIVPDMNILLRKLNEAGIKVKTEVSPDITNDYIIVK